VIGITDLLETVLYREGEAGRCQSMRKAMVTHKSGTEAIGVEIPAGSIERLPLWQLDIVELAGHNLEARGREEVNRLLGAGWRLLHIYTLKYEEDGVWRERPMGILGRLRGGQQSSLI
jgi:hypothetical protein